MVKIAVFSFIALAIVGASLSTASVLLGYGPKDVDRFVGSLTKH